MAKKKPGNSLSAWDNLMFYRRKEQQNNEVAASSETEGEVPKKRGWSWI